MCQYITRCWINKRWEVTFMSLPRCYQVWTGMLIDLPVGLLQVCNSGISHLFCWTGKSICTYSIIQAVSAGKASDRMSSPLHIRSMGSWADSGGSVVHAPSIIASYGLMATCGLRFGLWRSTFLWKQVSPWQLWVYHPVWYKWKEAQWKSGRTLFFYTLSGLINSQF
jgi:hypothetical protein